MKEVISKFKYAVHLATKDFKDLAEVEIDVSLVKMNSPHSDYHTQFGKYPILFEARYPDYLYDECFKLFPDEFQPKDEHMKRKGKSKIIYSPTITGIVDELSNYSIKLVMHYTHKDVYGDKVIFIYFRGDNTDRREGTYGADMGISNNITFQYFIAYRYIGKGQHWFDGERTIEKYSAPYKGNKFGGMHKEGEMVPLHHTERDMQNLKATYLIVPHTEEREAYLKEIQKSFTNITNKLNEFLKDLTEEKLDHLIATSPVMKLLTNGNDTPDEK